MQASKLGWSDVTPKAQFLNRRALIAGAGAVALAFVASAAPTFAPDGLYFLGPRYDAHRGLPTRAASFDWLPGGWER